MDGEVKLGELIERAIARPDDAQLLGTIGEIAREIAVRGARAQGLSDVEAEDVAQGSVEKLLKMVQRGDAPNHAEALVWRMAENAAKVVHRRRQSQQRGVDRLTHETDAQARAAEDAESLWLAREARDHAREVIREALALAPDTYRVALEHHLEGLPVQMLADTYFQEMVAKGGVGRDAAALARANKKARNRADQHLKRGKDWLRTHIQNVAIASKAEES